MCGIFGIISKNKIEKEDLYVLASHARQRGKDSSGMVYLEENGYVIKRSDYDIKRLLKNVNHFSSSIAMGHSRLITNGLSDNQPVVRKDIFALHNGIIVNVDEIWEKLKLQRKMTIDSEVIVAIANQYLKETDDIEGVASNILSTCEGVIACALALPKYGKLILFSNNGSLYIGSKSESSYFSSEKYPLRKLSCNNIHQVINDYVILDIPKSIIRDVTDESNRDIDLIPEFKINKSEEGLLEYQNPDIVRCSKCILPETMPFIQFDENGVCNYCNNYTPRNVPRSKEELFALVKPYRRNGELDCIIPFSGGRDSSYGLHLIVNELKMNPVTYTYDWGMVTDLGRRNISRMCSQLGIENIIIAADITQKRKNISMNLKAWLTAPHLGMVSILTAGDKHFFRHVETVKKQTGIKLNMWGVNPLEVTHFKAGFLGIKPYFEEKSVYSHGISKQLYYHFLRTKAMLHSLGYFNSSLWDTLSGEYYRSFTKKDDYFHIFDYWKWDEDLIDNTLINKYEWELAIDTPTTWRIGDGTAAFYNYIYYTVAGFTEHDTFRSNQIREGDITRQKALELVDDENRPRFPNIKWYLDAIGMDFKEVISIINNIQKTYR
jgi:glutamine---fructose-6-phosphate transaminase (isomerizing)